MNINNSLGYLLNTCARKMKNALDYYLKEYGITSSQLAVVKLLSEKEELTQAEIADTLNSDRATCGTVIEKLIKKDLVTKTTDRFDRRAFNVSLTQKGKEIIHDITNIANKINLLAIKGLTTQEVTELKEILVKIILNVEEGL